MCVSSGGLADEWATLRVICRTVDLESIQCVDPFSKSGFLEYSTWKYMSTRVAPGKSGPHEMARGSSSLLSSHGRVIGPQDGLKKDSRGLSRVTA